MNVTEKNSGSPALYDSRIITCAHSLQTRYFAGQGLCLCLCLGDHEPARAEYSGGGLRRSWMLDCPQACILTINSQQQEEHSEHAAAKSMTSLVRAARSRCAPSLLKPAAPAPARLLLTRPADLPDEATARQRPAQHQPDRPLLCNRLCLCCTPSQMAGSVN